jgi:transposase-like protein
VNANLLRSWVRKAERGGAPIAIQRTMPDVIEGAPEGFVPVPLQGPIDARIRIEVRRKSRRVSIEWPASAARDCAVLLKELMK